MSRFWIVCGLFAVNFCSLVFEIVASRKAATYLGATAYANSALLAAFLAGIGLGGWAASWRFFGSRSLSRWCGYLLLLAGAMSAACAPALTWLGQVGPANQFLRAALLTLLVLPVGLAVGFSYPVLTAMLSSQGSIGRGVATSYTADTLGAACGGIAAGFVLAPVAGLRLTGLIAGLGLAAIGLTLFGSRFSAHAQKTSMPRRAVFPAVPVRLVLALFFLTGLAALSLEVAWIRLFTLVVGTSVYSFSLTVAAFLAALGIGSHLIRSRADTITNPSVVLCRLMLLTAASCPTLLLLTPVWERLYLAAYQSTGSVAVFQLAVFALGLVSILLPAGLMGAGLSLGVRLVQTPEQDASGWVGRLYGINTLGGVLGALAAGLVLLPSVGVRGTILLSAAIYILAGAILSLKVTNKESAFATRFIGMGALGVLVPVWLLAEPVMFFAPYFHGVRLGTYESFTTSRSKEHLLYRRFSPYGLVTATEDGTYRYLRHNGRSEASTAPVDMSAQLLIAHLPLLMHPSPTRVMNIGLGAGFTLGAINQHSGLRTIVQAELDPRIVEAARMHFADVNANALADSRLEVVVTDGRKLLADDPATYDVIISEPSHLWVSGVSGLFTTEFYRIVALRLAPGGIFATWVPRYELAPDDIGIVAATLLDVFPHVTAFENGPSDIIFMASAVPFAPSLQTTRTALDNPGVTTDITRALTGFPLTPENLNHLLEQVAANSEAMATSVKPGTPFNTDDWPVLEFHTALATVSRKWHQTGQSP